MILKNETEECLMICVSDCSVVADIVPQGYCLSRRGFLEESVAGQSWE